MYISCFLRQYEAYFSCCPIMQEVIRRYVQKICVDKAKTYTYSLEMVQAPFFQQINQGIKQCCHNTEQDDAHKEPIHFKYLRRHSDTICI